MPLTRAFKSGNSQAIRIPADLAYDVVGQDLRISRSGDVLTIFPAKLDLRDAVAALRGLPKPPKPELLDRTEPPDRSSL